MTESKKFSFGLLIKLAIAIVLGILIGFVAPESIMRIIKTFTTLFSNYLSFVVPLIIIGFVVPGLSNLGLGAGKILTFSVVISYLSTILWGFVAYIVTKYFFPLFINLNQTTQVVGETVQEISPIFNIEMPPIMNITSAILLAFVLGVGISHIKSKSLKQIFEDFGQLISTLLNSTIIPFLPLFIAGIFAELTASGRIEEVISVYGMVFLAVIVLQIVINLIEYLIAIAYNKGELDLLTLLKNQIPSWLTGLGTQSSSATIPVTRETCLANGNSEEIVDFYVPLSATIHFPGSSIAIVSFATAVILMNNLDIGIFQMIGFILMAGVTMVAAPGVPGGAIMAALGLLESMLGFNSSLLALMVALYLAQDAFGTACSVAGNCAIINIIDKKYKDMKTTTNIDAELESI